MLNKSDLHPSADPLLQLQLLTNIIHARLGSLEVTMVMPDMGEREMKPLAIFNRCLDVLADASLCALATTLESKPRARAMEYAVDDAGIIYMLTEGGRKVRDILLNPTSQSRYGFSPTIESRLNIHPLQV
jgi:hypothetical protein